MQIHFALALVLYSLRASGSLGLATIGHLLDSADTSWLCSTGAMAFLSVSLSFSHS